MLKIDMHSHVIPADMPRFAQKFGYEGFIHLEFVEEGYANMMEGSRFFRKIKSNCWDPDLRIAEYDQYRCQVQVVCTIPVLFSYWAKAAHGAEISEFLNDHIAGLVASYPKRYIGLGTVPMQNTALAVKELERLKSIGLVGIQIGSNINDKNLSEPEFFPVFEACAELGLAVMIHPWNMMGKGHMEKYWLPWLVGMPAETTRAMCSLIFGGVHERLPNLRVCYSHAGGSFIPTLGRIEHGYRCRPDLVAVDNERPPSDYLGKFWVDSITHDPRLLRYIIDTIGSEKVCLGSDYPFPLGDLEIGRMVDEMNLPNNDVRNIFHRATLDWLQLSEEQFV